MPEREVGSGPNSQRKRKLSPSVIWPPLLWMALIWLVSSLPGRHLPTPKIISLDKFAHIGIYLILGLLTNRSIQRLGVESRHVWLIYIALLISAGLDEWHQCLIPKRSVSVWDFAANATGLVLAFVAFRISRDRS
ncbi:MAG TPA: VanZ family protein [Candidatus Syntrophosphaera sp.]|nr:VanZ family protein [Candidatus Syntrophosphaera sp.]HQP26953.1 VanZ family protein [Candidatus Syntrophosphaera sp.]